MIRDFVTPEEIELFNAIGNSKTIKELELSLFFSEKKHSLKLQNLTAEKLLEVASLLSSGSFASVIEMQSPVVTAPVDPVIDFAI
eukprot:CAMPEP_0168322550 /NCGR_PEP_ID=MMETSP0213-20121227/2953_1 /TAXON_ID=151035 /ORGANISM="Euplotes harpa, Strain FSP1.4" /LENGTH=84 /DNA_ID=CAMNT_0008324453 /DNA_START=382 /DNA_END=636 /DNA_ORIENTATION=-